MTEINYDFLVGRYKIKQSVIKIRESRIYKIDKIKSKITI